MQLEYYLDQITFIEWLEKQNSKTSTEFSKLKNELATLKYYFYATGTTSIAKRTEIDNLKNKIKLLLEKVYPDFVEYEKLNLPKIDKIDKIDRIEIKQSQQTFIKRTKKKMNTGVHDIDASPDPNAVTMKFTINGEKYVLEYIKDITQEIERTSIKKIATKPAHHNNSNSSVGIVFFKKKPKSHIIKKEYIFIHTKDGSRLIANKINDTWQYDTTNYKILTKIKQFEEKNNL